MSDPCTCDAHRTGCLIHPAGKRRPSRTGCRLCGVGPADECTMDCPSRGVRRPPLVTDAQLAKLLAPMAKAEGPTHMELVHIIRKLGEAYGWWVFAPPRAKGHGSGQWFTQGGNGMPDLLLVRVPTVLFVEVKVKRDKLRPEQRVVLGRLQQCTEVLAYPVRPEQLTDLLDILAAPTVDR